MAWRWDQGRLQYFALATVRQVAQVLLDFDGELIGGSDSLGDVLRQPLAKATGLPFSPNANNYKIWRNYGRVIGLQFLATQMANRLRVTEVSKALASSELSDEQYMQFVIKRFCYPSPCFEGYSSTETVVSPFAAVIKLLTSRVTQTIGSASIDEIASLLIGNEVTGMENLGFYRRLRPTSRTLQGDEERQLREMIIFLSQAPFLTWDRPKIYLDVSSMPSSWESLLAAYATPEIGLRLPSKEEELLRLGNLGATLLPHLPAMTEYPEQKWFVEGHRKRTTHFTIERSVKVRQMFMNSVAQSSVCDMCHMNTSESYPWSRTLIEVHHLLSLGSVMRLEPRHTSLNDLVGVCPTCHRATHHFYRTWLTDMGLDDFRSTSEAKHVYNEAKQRTVGFEWRTHG